MEYTLERLSESRLEDLLYLIEDAYGRKDSLNRLKIKYKTDFWGSEYIGYIAYSKTGEPAAYYGVLPIRMMYKNQTILAAQSGDTMTHSGHRRKGLFTKLAKETYELARKEGINIIFGFPNENSYPGFARKLDWQFTERMINFNIITPCLPIAQLINKTKSIRLEKLQNKWADFVLSKFHKEVSLLQSSISKDEDSMVINRDSNFEIYKNKGKYKVVCNSAIAWLKYDGSLTIGDIYYTSINDVSKLIRKLRVAAILIGTLRIRTYISPDVELSEYLKSKYSFRDSLFVGCLPLSPNLPINKMKFTYADFDTF